MDDWYFGLITVYIRTLHPQPELTDIILHDPVFDPFAVVKSGF